MDNPSLERIKSWLSRGLALIGLLFLLFFWSGASFSQPPRHVRTKVRFWHMWTAEWKDVVDKIVKRYNDSQDVYEVEALSVPSAGADSKFILGVLGGDPPDVMAQWNPIIPPWAEGHLLRPLDELMTPAEKADFDRQAYPVVKKMGTYKGKLYGMSIGMNMFGLYYLPDHMKEAGIAPHAPQTLEELDEIGKKLDKFDANGNLTRLGWLPTNYMIFAAVFGGGFYDWNGEKLTMDTPENLRALQYISDSNKALGFGNVQRFNAGLDTQSSAGGWPFIGGAYSFIVDGAWRVEQIAKYAPNLHYETCPIPPPKGGKPLAGFSSGNFMVVPTSAKEPKGAWDFIKFWSGLENPNVAAEFYTWGGWLPLTPAIAQSPIYQAYLHKFPQFKTFVDLMPSENETVLPPVPFQTFFNDHIGTTEESVTHGTLTATQALSGFTKTVSAEANRRKELGYDR